MINSIVELLDNYIKEGKISDYLLNEVEEESYQLYFVKESLETVRDGRSTSISVTVYVKHDEKLGSSSFLLYPSSTKEEIETLVDEARSNALGIFNAPYELVKGGKETYGENKGKDLKKEAERIANAIFSVKGSDGAKLNATEIFVYNTRTRVINSLGLDKTSYTSRGMVETIPTFDKKEESVEIYAQKNFAEISDEEMKSYIREKLDEVEARANVAKRDLPSNVDVLLREEEIETIFADYIYMLTYSALASGGTPFKEGQKVFGDNGDPITMEMKGKVAGCSSSRYFDQDGTTLKDKVVIEKGTVSSFFGDNRFSQYVKRENTGNLAILSVNPGSLEEGEIEGDYLECLQFSGIQADIFNDYLGGEVRLALYHHDGKKIPVGGFSISGKLSELLSSARLSKHISKDPSYCGPSHIFLKKMALI
ncbi:MAG: hypothetical protein K6B65_04245 [Bacilli bacterium]|nr:hypothetical protein [Bacilli bacterium]